jgi:peroxin-19
MPLTIHEPIPVLTITDVLDDFSKPKTQPAQPAPAPASASALTDSGTGVTPPDFDEDAFLKQLEKDMANMMGNAPPGAAEQPDFQNTVDQGADVFAKQLEESGIPPGDFLKQLLADVMAEEGGAGAGSGTGSSAKASPSAAATNPAGGDHQPAESFNDAIQRTMERMKESGNKAAEAATTDDGVSDDMLAQLLKAVEAGAGEDGDLTKMFMGMMEQLSNKEMLYEPMKELDGKFGPWIEKNKAEDKVPAEDMSRYETQAKVVKQIVQKFEEPGYTDEDPKCREYIWERMQEVMWSWFVCDVLMLTLSTDASGRQPTGGTDFQPAHGGSGRSGRVGRRRCWRGWRSARLPAAIEIWDLFDTHSCSSACSVLYIYTTMSIPLFTPSPHDPNPKRRLMQ